VPSPSRVTATVIPSALNLRLRVAVLAPEVQEDPTLARATFQVPALRLSPFPLSKAFPRTGFRGSGYSAGKKRGVLQAAWIGVGGEASAAPPRTGLAIRAPLSFCPFGLPPGSRASSLPPPPDASRRPQRRPAPHTYPGYVFVFPGPVGGTLTPFRADSPRGWTPVNPFRVAQPPAPVPRGFEDWRRAESYALNARR